jgi:N-glycosylase/DNA lyase
MRTTVELIQQAIIGIAPEIESRMGQRKLAQRPDERQLWAEMSCCILSSQVPYGTALAAACQLDTAGLLYDPFLKGRDLLELRLNNLLASPITVEGKQQRYRFPAMRAAQIAGAWSAVRRESGTLSELLEGAQEPNIMREWLVCNVPGLGPKQATMFLRNVGVSYDMAIIDRHVLRYMSITGLGSSAKSKTLTSLRAYKDLEVRLRNNAQDLGYAVGVMDWAIWIVMRLVNEVEPA